MFNKYNKIIKFFICLSFFVLFFWNAFAQRKDMLALYNDGINKMNIREYQEAIEIFEKLGDYKDSFNLIKDAQSSEQKKEIYNEAKDYFNNENYECAIDLFQQIEDYDDSKKYIEMANLLKEQKEANETLYDEAYSYYISGNYILAIQKFTELNGYKDSDELLLACRKELAKLQQATTISAGIRSSVGMIRHGKVYLAGNDEYSWKSELEGWNNIISVSVKGNFVVALKDDGTVVMAGKIPEYYVGTKTWNDIIAVSTGQQYIIGLKSDGTLVAQGHNGDGQVNIDEWDNMIDVAAGWRHTVGLNAKGEIYITGLGSERQLKEIDEHKSDWTNIIAIDAGGGSSGSIGSMPYTVALKENGTAVTTLTGEIANEISEWSDIIAISAGDSHIVGLKSNGTVVTTQQGQSAKEISEWNDIVAVSAGYGFTLGLKSNGTVVAAGYDHDGQIDVGSWENITDYEEAWKSIFDENLRWHGNS